MVCVLGMALAFCMAGCNSCPTWCPFSSGKAKATCTCCDKVATCKCAKDGNNACVCCKDGAACKCEGCKNAPQAANVICKCCNKDAVACTCSKDGKDACACCKDGAACKCESCKPAPNDCDAK